jgi:hypothetical protein
MIPIIIDKRLQHALILNVDEVIDIILMPIAKTKGNRLSIFVNVSKKIEDLSTDIGSTDIGDKKGSVEDFKNAKQMSIKDLEALKVKYAGFPCARIDIDTEKPLTFVLKAIDISGIHE